MSDALRENVGIFSRIFLRMKLLPGRHPRHIRKVHCGDGIVLEKQWDILKPIASVSELGPDFKNNGFVLSDVVHLFKGPDQCIVVLVYAKTPSYLIPLDARREAEYLLQRVRCDGAARRPAGSGPQCA